MSRGRPSELVLFVDPNFWDDPRVRALSPADRDQYLRILAEQLKARNGAHLPWGAWGVPRTRLRKYVEAGLLREEDDDLVIEDWDAWNGREAYKRFLTRERVRRLRARRHGDL